MAIHGPSFSPLARRAQHLPWQPWIWGGLTKSGVIDYINCLLSCRSPTGHGPNDHMHVASKFGEGLYAIGHPNRSCHSRHEEISKLPTGAKWRRLKVNTVYYCILIMHTADVLWCSFLRLWWDTILSGKKKIDHSREGITHIARLLARITWLKCQPHKSVVIVVIVF